MSGCAQAQANFYNLENFVGCRDCSMSHGRTTTHLPEASKNKPTDWHQICRRSGRSVSHLLVCRIPFLCRCVYSCLSRFRDLPLSVFFDESIAVDEDVLIDG